MEVLLPVAIVAVVIAALFGFYVGFKMGRVVERAKIMRGVQGGTGK